MITGTTRATPVLLWSRAALLAVVVVAVSAVGHVSAEGLLPGPGAMLGLTLAATAVSARFLTRQASPVRLVMMLVSGQVAIHGLLTVLAGHAGDATGAAAGSPGAASGAAHGAHPAAPFVFDGLRAERTGSYFDQVEAMQAAVPDDPASTTGSGFGGVAHLVEHLSAQGMAMVVAHLAVVALLGAWLAVGERALWTVLTLTTTRLLGVAGHAAALVLGRWPEVLLDGVRSVRFLRSTGRDAVPLPHLLHHVVAHRGPPSLLAAA